MEYETISKETPEMKQLISDIRNLTKRVRTTAQIHRPLFEGELYLTGREVCKGSFFLPAPYRIIGTRAFSHTRRLQERYSIVCLTCNGFYKRIM